MVKRKVTYRLYPNVAQTSRLKEMLVIHQHLYNMALEERIRTYQEECHTLSFFDQCKALTIWRRENAKLAEVNAQSLQVTLKRLHLAFQAFFRRVKSGQTPGFPRFKSIDRYSGWGYKTYGDGFSFIEEKDGSKKLKLSGVGIIKLRGKARNLGDIKTCEILHKAGKWYVSVTIECQPKRTSGKAAIGIDWGVEKFITTQTSDGQTNTIDNPRHLKSALPKIKKLQKSIAKKTNKKSKNRRKAVKKLARMHANIANQRKDFHHQVAAGIVKNHGLIAVETLSVKAMTKSGGNRKSGLNREILSTAPTQFHNLLKSKAEEAGIIWVEIPTREVKPSQTCHQCFIQIKKSLSERMHICDCGVNCTRDENAARVILNYAMSWASGQELAEVGSPRGLRALNQETHAIP